MAVHLPRAGDAEPDAEAAAVPFLIESVLILDTKKLGISQANISVENIHYGFIILINLIPSDNPRLLYGSAFMQLQNPL